MRANKISHEEGVILGNMKPQEVIDEIRIIVPSQIRKEHDFRVKYLKSLHAVLRSKPRVRHYQLKRSAVWMSLYSHINWLAHFKFLKTEKVDSYIPTWLATTFGWPSETAEAFWYCGRNPIAHTGSQNLPYSKNIKGAKRYIQLSFDNPTDWSMQGAFMALPESAAKRPAGTLPIQQTTFFYRPTEQLLEKLMDDVALSISTLDHADLLKLQKVMMSFNFFKDDGSLARMNNLLDVYEHVKDQE